MAWRALAGMVLFVCAEAGAQEVTLSARVKVLDTEHKAESSHAENVVVWLTPIGDSSPVVPVPKQPLRLSQHSEPGLCRSEFLESFTTVRLSSGMVLSWEMAKQMGYLPADAQPEDLR